MKRKKLTEQQVLNIAKHYGSFSVHRYKYSQQYLKSICKRLEKQGKLKYAYHTSELIFYRGIV